MAIQRELTLRLPNSPGALARVVQLLGAERVNVLALALDATGHLRLVVDNPLHAAGALREQHYQVDERDVLFASVPSDPGSLATTLRLIGDHGINVEYAYACNTDRSPSTSVVIGVADAQRAAYVSGI